MVLTKSKITEASQSVSDQARVVLVPLANPETALHLLRLATALTHSEEGKVVALIVSLGDMEDKAKAIDKLQKMVENLRDEGHNIVLETVEATSIARGILDTARQLGADLIMLGIKRAVRGEIQLGAVVESVINTSPCDVLVYRHSQSPEFSRVVIPVDDSFQTQVAARVGIRLAKGFNTRIEAMYAQSGSRSVYEGLAHIEQAIADIPGREAVKRTVITAQNPVQGILTRTSEDDLLMVGFGARRDLGLWMSGDIARGLLDKAEGPVVIVSRSHTANIGTGRLLRRFTGWVRPALTRIEQDEIVRNAQDMATLTIDYVMLILVAATLATLGLLLNSAAVIIGAMLVAPLMSPLIGLSTGLTVGRVFIAQRALLTLVIGVGMALLVAVFLGVLLPFNTPTMEMNARGQPTLLDAAVALASGIVGAYATARKDIPAALAGVAIAAALMPPVCTVGLGLAFGMFDLAFGAAILFSTNIICIILAGVLVFFWLGMGVQRYPHISPLAQWVAIGLLVAAAIPVAVELVVLTRETQQDTAIRDQLALALDDSSEVTEFTVERGDPMRITATVRSSSDLTSQDVAEIQRRIAQELGETLHLELVVQPVVRLAVEPEDAALVEPPVEVTAPVNAPLIEVTAEAAP
ncbi:MAG: hypothetical protein OHK0046_23100 [Anaerolineae bacterium]